MLELLNKISERINEGCVLNICIENGSLWFVGYDSEGEDIEAVYEPDLPFEEQLLDFVEKINSNSTE